jgi:hypothetical protein
MASAMMLLGNTSAYAYDRSDTLAAIDQASADVGISWGYLYRVVGCETGWRFDPYEIGDHGTSLGVAQLHQGGNALPAFYVLGYDDPFDPYQAVNFLAHALMGEIPGLGAHSWSCK